MWRKSTRLKCIEIYSFMLNGNMNSSDCIAIDKHAILFWNALYFIVGEQSTVRIARLHRERREFGALYISGRVPSTTDGSYAMLWHLQSSRANNYYWVISARHASSIPREGVQCARALLCMTTRYMKQNVTNWAIDFFDSRIFRIYAVLMCDTIESI